MDLAAYLHGPFILIPYPGHVGRFYGFEKTSAADLE
jgi:hypothetical protein